MTDEHPITMSGRSVPLIQRGLKTQTRRLVNLDELRILLPARVHAEMGYVGDPTSLAAGRYHCRLNPQGAVIAKGPSGFELGIRPGEFDFECRYARGITKLEGRSGSDDKVWTIHPFAFQRLWVREEWGVVSEHSDASDEQQLEDARNQMPWASVVYKTDEVFLKQQPRRWRRAMFMPRWACRLVLRPVVVRLERLHRMTEEDAVAEGASPVESQDGIERTALEEFARIWDSIHGKGAQHARFQWSANPWVWSTTFTREEVS